ncbi:probable ATP-dependent RNA helicase DDX20 [Branchiostoma floridae]|uniref:RNA helicase n=1 Tax=Branchiostoma floridae TaxID=7739 RepID=A0A9J7MRH3_BRAFL|nr:probable ATP-dependent RNA helicase DDX20 [Branchiostoma floridae]
MSSPTVWKPAHKLREGCRTEDVLNTEGADFASLLLSEPVQRGLTLAGFERPSPIQLKAIPLGRCGLDLIVQAKSGTGKTCVFAVIALESLVLETFSTQVLVLAPTREIAVQIHDVVVSIGQAMSGLKCHVFIGGLPVHEDKQRLRKCHVAIGSPGRIKQLIELGVLKTTSIRLFVLDEADKLLETGSFQEQINWIYSSLPDNKQMVALSATYPESLAHHLQVYMRDPTFVRLDIQDLSLKGIKQFYSVISQQSSMSKAFQAKTDQLIKLLSRVPFHQCLVFSNDQGRAQSLCKDLNSKGWPTAYIAGSQEQTERLNAMSQLRNFQCRVLVSTDLTARGIDAEKVNLVVNLDVPQDWETYMHRIGRAGRFGTQGAAVTLVYSGKEESRLEIITKHCRLSLQTLPNPIPSTLITSKDMTWEVMSSGDQVTVTTLSTMTKDCEGKDAVESPTNVIDHGNDPDTSITGRASPEFSTSTKTNGAVDVNTPTRDEACCQSQQGVQRQAEQHMNDQSEQSFTKQPEELLSKKSEELLNNHSEEPLNNQSQQTRSGQFHQQPRNLSNSSSECSTSIASRSTQSLTLSDSFSQGSYSLNGDESSFDNSVHEVFLNESEIEKETKIKLESNIERKVPLREVRIPSLASFKRPQKVRLTFQQAAEDLEHFLTHGEEKYGAHNIQQSIIKQTMKESERTMHTGDGPSSGVHETVLKREKRIGSGRLRLVDELSNMSDHIEEILNSYGEVTSAKALNAQQEEEYLKHLEPKNQNSEVATEIDKRTGEKTWSTWTKQGARPKGSKVPKENSSKFSGVNNCDVQRLKRTEREGSDSSTDGSWEQQEEETIDFEGEEVSNGEWEESEGEETDDEWEEDESDETETDEEYSDEDYSSYDDQQRSFHPDNQENYNYRPDKTYSQYPDHAPPPYYAEYSQYGENMNTQEFSEQYSSASYWSVPERTAIGETWCCCGRRDCVRNRWLSTWARAYSSQCLYMAAMLGNRHFR